MYSCSLSNSMAKAGDTTLKGELGEEVPSDTEVVEGSSGSLSMWAKLASSASPFKKIMHGNLNTQKKC